MMSILIPTYNYNAFPLVKAIYEQAQNIDIPFEIICRDDGSQSAYNIENTKINTLANCTFIEAEENIGRSANRLALATQASYDWLLFLDSDVLPKSANFLKNYIHKLETNAEAIFGGFAYHEDHKTEHNSLRFKFGKQREEVPANTRNNNPYKVIISANFMIKKDRYLTLHKTNLVKTYGGDYLFGAKLKQHTINIAHINNEVYHLGIDTNTAFLKKTREAIETLYVLSKSSKKVTHAISLLKSYEFLKQFKIDFMFLYLFNKFEPSILHNLESQNPSIRLFDIYRLGTFCKKKRLEN
jgi:glycosyltransferase involved in cell wall biosynthesis